MIGPARQKLEGQNTWHWARLPPSVKKETTLDSSGFRAQELCESRVPNSPYGLCERKATLNLNVSRAQVLCERRGGRPGLSVLNSPYGLCGRKATLN